MLYILICTVSTLPFSNYFVLCSGILRCIWLFYVVLYSVRQHELIGVGWHQNKINPLLNFLPISFMDDPQSEHYDQDTL